MTVVFDLDGTTIFKGNKMTREVADAIRTLNKHQRVVFASARPIRDMLPVLPTDFHQFDLIGGNGAFIRTNNVISTTSFSDEEKELIFKLIEEHHLDYMVDSDWDYAYKGDKSHPFYLGIDPLKVARNQDINQLKTVVKSVLFTTDEQIINQLKEAGIIVHLHTSEKLIDISPNNISKWSGFSKIKDDKPFIMFGNDMNDLSMFERASHSYVVGKLVEVESEVTYIEEEQVVETILSLTK